MIKYRIGKVIKCTITPNKKVIVQQKYRNYRLVMCTFLLAQRTYVSSVLRIERRLK